jgi:CRISPR-associated endonuclease/helicase Cas3
LHLESVRQWLAPSELDLEIITAAVLCHHLQASPKKKEYVDAFGRSRSGVKEVQLYLNNSQVREILTEISQIAQLDRLPDLPDKWISGDSFWENVYLSVRDTADEFDFDLEDNPERRTLLLAVKAGLIAADSVASGIFRVHSSEAIEQWVSNTLHREPITFKEIEEKILQPRYRQIEKKTGKPFKLKSFQEQAVDLSSRLLLLSGCGTGKTIFAYKWQQGVLKNREVGRVIFLYPTRGTATEGFKDYVSWAPETDASLLTGTAIYELKAIAENPSESTKDKEFITEEQERLYALGFWSKRFFSATVDRFLSFLTHSYTGIGLLPVLADSVVVIDEVHSFSRSMFDNLISFLEHFDIPVLCMTATLPASRKKELMKQGLAIFPTKDRSELQELEEAENRPRYLIHNSDYDTAFTEALTAYREGKRVLWVVNAVDRCRETANKLEAVLKTELLIYHSRFRLKDRKDRHQDTVRAFQEIKQPVIAVTTQVCEMSLDLDADVLITELAPISALVQRFGRSNRHGLIDYAHIWVYEPPKVLPYKKEEIEIAKTFLANVTGVASQKNLAENLEKYALKERYADGSSSFVNGGYWATSEAFRETKDYSVNAILDRDIDDFLKLREQKNPDAEGYILPVPKKFAQFKSENRLEKLPKYLAIADSQFYCEKRGFGDDK